MHSSKEIGHDATRSPSSNLRVGKMSNELNHFISEIAKSHGINVKNKNLIKDDANTTIRLESKHQRFFLKISKYDTLPYEVFWHKKAGENGINVSKVLVSDFSKRIIPFMYGIFEFIDGTSLDLISHNSLRQKAAILAGIELRKLHEIATDGVGVVDAAGAWSDKSWPLALMRFMGMSKVRDQNIDVLFNPAELNKIMKHIFSVIPDNNGNRLINSDAQPQNIIYIPSQNKVVLTDPKKIIGGDPMFDLARTRIPLSVDSFHDHILEGYQLSAKLTLQQKELIEAYYLAFLFYATNSSYHNRVRYGLKYKRFKALLDGAMKDVT